MDWFGISLTILIMILMIILIVQIPKIETRDEKRILQLWKKMKEKDLNNNCGSYLNKIDRYPTWRYALIQSIIISMVSILFICLITDVLTIRNLVLIFLVIILISFITTCMKYM